MVKSVARSRDRLYPPPGGGGSGWGCVQPKLSQLCARPRFAAALLQHIIVPKSQDPPGSPLQVRVALLIATVGVLSAVHLDNEFFCVDACEIHNVWRDRMLSPEPAPELITTKFSPQRAVRCRSCPDANIDCALSAKVRRASPPPSLPCERGREMIGRFTRIRQLPEAPGRSAKTG